MPVLVATRPRHALISLLAVSGALAFAAMAGRASAQPYDPAGPVSDIDQICRSTVGVSPGEAHYVGCVQSLAASQSAFGHDRAIGVVRSSCLQEGLRPNTPELAQCTLSRSRNARIEDIRAVASTDHSGAARSYFYASPSEAHRREEASCASLGLDPGSGGFASCVANMQSAMFAADNPLD